MCTCLILGNAVTLPPPNPCLPNPCRNGGVCQATNAGSFTCLCPPGFEGISCEIREFYIKIFFILYNLINHQVQILVYQVHAKTMVSVCQVELPMLALVLLGFLDNVVIYVSIQAK
jgi:hypothetical protein